MKYVKLLAAAYVNGNVRHPHEGALHLEDAEAKRLVDGGLGQDVTDDFDAKANKAAPVETITASGAAPAAPDLPPEPHQAQIAPQAADAAAPTQE